MRKMIVLLASLLFSLISFSQSVKTITIDFSGRANNDTTIYGVSRSGDTCGGSNCVVFKVILHPGSDQLSLNASGAPGLGSATYQVNCGTTHNLADPACISGLSIAYVTFCKPGNNTYNYTITTSTAVKGSDDLTLRQNCSGTMSVAGLQAASVNWTSVYPGTPGQYNSGYLSSTTGSSVTITPQAGSPAYIDYRVYGSTSACNAAKDDTIRVYTTPALSIPITPANPAICSGAAVTLTASPSGGKPPYTYVWNPGGGTLATTSATVAGTYTVTVSDNTSGCAPVPQGITVAALPTPSAPTASGTTICAGSTATVTASAPGGTYQWYDAASGGNLLFTGASYTTPTLNASTNYYVQTTISGCTSTRTTVTVTVTPTAAAPSVSPATICAGSTATLAATGTGTLDWFAAASGGNTLQTGGSYTTPVLNTSTTYYVQNTVSNCISARTAVTATVNPIPAAPTAASTAICTGSSVTLSATAPGGSYTWYDMASGGTALQTGSGYITPVLTANTSYYVQTVVSGCTSARTTVNISVNATPPLPVVDPAGICTGNAAIITLNSPLSGVTYGWYSAATGGTLLITGTSYTTPVLTTNTDYFVQANLAGCSSSGRVATTVTVSSVPAAPVVSPATTCSGSTALLTATGSGTLDWYAAASGGSSLQTGTGFTTLALTSSTGYYVQNTVSGCASPRTSVAVTVNPIPAAPAVADAAICMGSSALLTATSPGGTYEWFTTATGGSPVFTGISFNTPVLNATTVYYVQTTVSACTGNRTMVTVTTNPIPAVPGVSVVSICSGNTTIATVNSPVAGVTYRWYDASSGGSLLATGTSYTTPVLAATTSYYAQAELAGCTSARATATASVTPTPAAPSAGVATICAGNTATITTTAPGTVNWYAAISGGSPLQTGSSYTTPVLNTSTIYYVQTTVSGCTSVRASITASVTPIPAAPTAANAATCNGSTATLLATGPGGSYDWFTVASGGVSAFTGASFTTPVLNANTNYYVQTVVSGCTGARTTVNVSVNSTPPLPVVDAVGICTGNAATLSVNSPLSGVTYEWYDALTGGTLLATATDYTTPVLNTTTSYYVQANLTGCSSSTRAQVNVTVSGQPAPPAAPAATICSGNTTTLTASATVGTLDWFATASGGSSLKPGTDYTTPVLTTSATYYVQASVSGCASTRTPVTVTVNPVPVPPTAADATICSGSPVTLTATAPGGTYSWHDAASGGNLLANGASYAIPSLNATTIYYVQTAVLGCVSSRTMVTVTTNAIPPAPSASGATICAGITATLTASGSSTGYRWYDALTGGSLVSAVASYTTPSLNNTTSYYVETTVSGCTSPRTMVTVTVNPTPPAPTATPATICEGNTATITATGTGALNWFAVVSGGTSLQPPGGSFTTSALNTTTTYYVQNTVSGCASTRTPVTVTVNPIPTAPTAADATICSGSPVTLTATAPGGTYTWHDAASNGSLLANGASYTIPSVSATTIYYVQTAVSGCVSSRTMVRVTTSPIPAVPTIAVTPVCAGNATTITVTSPVAGVAYQWYDASSAGNLLATGTGFTTPALNGNANYYVQANLSGCTSNRITAAVPVTPLPAAPTAAAVFICTGNTAVVTATGPGGTYEWYDAAAGGNLLLTGTNYTTPVLTATTQYYVQTALSGCTGLRSAVTVNVNPAPAAPTVAGSTICAGNNVSLTATAPGGTYQWYDAATGGNLLLTGFNYITPSLNSTTTYYVQSSVAGCTGSRTPVTVAVTQPPPAPTATGVSVCAGSGASLTASAPGGSYQWYDAASGGNLLYTGVSYTLSSISNTTTFYVQTTVGFCTGQRTAVTVAVNPMPPAPTSSGGSICAGNPVILSAGGSMGIYQWYDSTVSGSLLSSGTSFTTPVLNATRIYYVQATQSGCTSTRTAVTATVIPIQQPAFQYPSGTLCVSGSNATPAITGGSGGVFSATPTGLVFANTGTGEINAAASALGTYTITYVTGGVCVYSSTAKLTITNAPDASFAYNGPYCPQQLTTLPDFPSGANAGIFTASAGGLIFKSSSTGEIDLQKSTPGVYTLTNTIAAAGSCAAAMATDTLTILPQPVVTAGPDQSICAGAGVSLNGSISGSASKLNWSGGTGTFTDASQTATQYTPAAGETTVKLYATTDDPSGPCVAAVDSLTIFINPLPALPVVQDVSVCTGNAATLVATAPGGTYDWYDTQSGPVIFTGNTFTSPVLTAGRTYYVQSTINHCSGSKTAVTVNVSPKPSIISAPTGEVCSANSFTYLIASDQPGSSYAWARSVVTGISNPAFNGQTDSSITEVLNNTTNNIVPVTYSIIPTNKGCTGDPFFYTASVKPTPTAPAISNSTPVCAGTPLNLFTSAVTGATYQWSGPDGFSSTQQNPVVTNVTLASAGIYRLVITVNNCTSSPSAKNIAPVIAAPAVASNSPLCEQGTLRLTAGGLLGATYSWRGPAGFISGNQNPVLPSVISSQGGMYYVTASIAGCTGLTDSVPVMINVPPSSPSIASNSPVCAKDSIMLKTLSAAPNISFQWSGPAGFKSTLPSPLIPVADKANEGLYNLTVSSPGCSITSASSLTVVVNLKPLITTVSNNGPLCEGDTLLLNASSLPGAAFSWNSSSGYRSSLQNPSIPGITKANEESYKVFATLNGCTSDTVTTTVAITKASIANAGSNRTVCANNASVILIGNITGEDTQTGAWRTNGTGSFFPNANQLSSTYLPSPSDTAKRKIILTLQTTNNKVCPVSLSTIEIGITPAPVVNAGADGLVCANDSLITVSGKIINATSGSWYAGGSGSFQQGGSSLTKIYTPSRADIQKGNVRFYLVSTLNGNCLAESDTVSYIIQPIPVVNAGNDLTIFENETVRLNPQVTGSGNLRFLWTPDSNLSSDTVRNPLLTGKNNQDYTVRVTGTGSCVSEDILSIKVLKPFIIPNIFTPNGDGIHDTWEIPELNNYPGSIVEVFTRSGQKIFGSIGYERPWDGTYNGKPVPVATYYYIVKPNFRNQVFSGSVTVVR